MKDPWMEMLMHPRVHILQHGRSLCGFPGPHWEYPSSWPPHHVWVPLEDIHECTCLGCITEGARLVLEPAGVCICDTDPCAPNCPGNLVSELKLK